MSASDTSCIRDHRLESDSLSERPRRILQAVTSVCAGGQSRYLLDLMSHTRSDACEQHLVCTHFAGPHFGEARSMVRSATLLNPRNQCDKLLQLCQLMRRLRPDVVHAHQEPIALVAARLAGVPERVETIHLARYWLQDGHPLLRALARR